MSFSLDSIENDSTINGESRYMWPKMPDEEEGSSHGDSKADSQSGVDVGRAFNAVDMAIPENALSEEDRRRSYAQCSHTNPLQREDFEASLISVLHIEYLEWLEENRLYLMESENPDLTWKVLLKLADDLKVLPPGNDRSDEADYMDTLTWRQNLNTLIEEMQSVVKDFPPEIYNEPRGYVLTTWPYGPFLRKLAQEIMK